MIFGLYVMMILKNFNHLDLF